MNTKLKVAMFCGAAFVLGAIVGSTIMDRSARSVRVTDPADHVTGIGGIFFKSGDAESTRAWYREHLGITGEGPGVNFFWREHANPELTGFTVWSVFPADTGYFGAEQQQFMVNYRVRDLDSLLARLADQGIQRIGEMEEYSYGRFAWIRDGDGRRVELWEPVYSAADDSE